MEPVPSNVAGDSAPSRAQHQRQPGATARLDLQNWSNPPFDDEAPYVVAGPIHTLPSAPMQTEFGPTLAKWMRGNVHGQNIKRPRRREDETSARAFLATALTEETIQRLNAMNVYAGDVSVALRDGLSAEDVDKLLTAGAGHHAFAFLIEAKDTSIYRTPLVTVHRILARWGPHTELITERFVALARSERVKNPEQLKSWYMGIGTKDVAADGYATMINDAVDLIEAGHDIALEEMPKGMAPGLGDIIDLTEKIVYQHKRVAGKTLTKNISKGVKQLAGFGDTPGAPEGFIGVVQIDARNNSHYANHTDQQIADMIGETHLDDDPKFHEVQVVFDDRMLVFDRLKSLARIVRPETQGAATPEPPGASAT